jgi:hypothetical protein
MSLTRNAREIDDENVKFHSAWHRVGWLPIGMTPGGHVGFPLHRAGFDSPLCRDGFALVRSAGPGGDPRTPRGPLADICCPPYARVLAVRRVHATLGPPRVALSPHLLLAACQVTARTRRGPAAVAAYPPHASPPATCKLPAAYIEEYRSGLACSSACVAS